MTSVERARVFGLEALHHDGESIAGLRFEDEVDVIRHEGVGDDTDFVLGGVAVQERKVEVAVGVGEEDVLAVVAALRDVLGESGRCESWHASHC